MSEMAITILTNEQAIEAGISPALFKGDRGDAGENAYLHIKYAASATPGDADMSDAANDFIGLCADHTEIAPTTASSYTWARINSAAVQTAVEALKDDAETAQAAAETAKADAETAQAAAETAKVDAETAKAAAETAKADAETAQAAAEAAKAAAETAKAGAETSESNAAASAAAAAISAQAAGSAHPSVNIQPDTTTVSSPIAGGSFDVVDGIIRNTLGHVEKINVKTVTLPSEVDISGKVDKVTGKGLSTEDYTTTEKTKLAGVATGATANDTDANLKNRANHTGAQAISTVTGLQAALDGKAFESTQVLITLLSTGWTGSDAPYTQTVAVAGLAASGNGYAALAQTATATQRESAVAALLNVTGQAAGSLTFSADGDRPTTNIPVVITIIG